MPTFTVEIRGSEAITCVAGGATYAIPVAESTALDLRAAGFVVHTVEPAPGS